MKKIIRAKKDGKMTQTKAEEFLAEISKGKQGLKEFWIRFRLKIELFFRDGMNEP